MPGNERYKFSRKLLNNESNNNILALKEVTLEFCGNPKRKLVVDTQGAGFQEIVSSCPGSD